jgi:Zn-finger nucleic acid-binding protein
MTMDCPKCTGKLEQKPLTLYELSEEKDLQGADITEELDIYQCFVCGGVWFDKGVLDVYLKEGLKSVDSPSLGSDLDQKLNTKKGKCPVCQVEMIQQPYALDHGVQIDLCPKCEGIWLDSTEIDRLESEEWKLQPVKSFFAKAINSILRSRKGFSGS